MIIPKIVKVLQSLDESQRSTHKKLDALQLSMQKLLRASGSARTPLVREKPVKCDTEELRVALHDKSQVALESVHTEYQLSTAIYSARRPKNLQSKEQILQVKSILEAHKSLNKLTNSNKAQLDKIEKAMRVLKLKLDQVDSLHIKTKPKEKIFRP